MIVWFFFLITYYMFLVIPFVKYNKIDALQKSFSVKNITVMAGVFILFGLFIYSLISQEQYIYFWDSGGYYERTIQLARSYNSNPSSIMEWVYKSSVNDDYGMWIPAIIAYPFMFTEGRYIDYILIMYVMLVVPVVLSLCFLILSCINNYKDNTLFLLVIMLVTMPWLMVPMLKGYPGIAALLPIICSLWILFKKGFNKLDIWDALILSIALIFAAMQRRYFSFWIVGFVVASMFYSLSKLLVNNEGKKELIKYIRGYILVGTISLLILSVGFNGFLERVLLVDYSEIYAAYSVGSFTTKYFSLFKHLGFAVLVVTTISICILMRDKQHWPYIIFMISFETFTTAYFFTVQSPGQHHYWIFFIPIILIILLAVAYIQAHNNTKNSILTGLILIGLLFNSLYVYTGSFVKEWNSGLFQQDRYVIRMRTDISEIKKIRMDLESLQGKTDKIYVTASSDILNNELLNKSYLPEISPLKMCKISNVDMRDGFSTDFFNATLVLSTDKTQTHLKNGTQRVVTILNDEMNDIQSPIRQKYSVVETYTLDKNIIATLYRRESDFTINDVNYLQKKYNEYYMDYPDLFNNRFEEYKVKIE